MVGSRQNGISYNKIFRFYDQLWTKFRIYGQFFEVIDAIGGLVDAVEADGGHLEDLRVQADPQQGPQGPRDGRRDGSSVRFTNSSNIFVLKHEEEEIANMHFTANPGGIQGCCHIVQSTFVHVSFMT